jgi:hypothetical protein
MTDPVEIARVLDRAQAIARTKGVTMPDEDLRRELAVRLFRELRAERRLGRES